MDGPGTRSVFFLQGCPLRCAFCHNPDSQKINAGEAITPAFILDKVARYESYFGEDGGVTFSGGEPLLQGEFLYETLKLLKKKGINICIDTSGAGDKKYYDKIFPLLDYMLLDVKAFDESTYKGLIRGSFDEYLSFINNIEKNGFKGEIILRHVMIPNVSDDEKSMDKLIENVEPILKSVSKIEILPYHTLGVEKYEKLGRKYELKGITPIDKNIAKELEIYANKKFAKEFKKSSKANIFKNSTIILANGILDTLENKNDEFFTDDEILRNTALTRETVIRKLEEFRDYGYIDYKSKKEIRIKDKKLLENFRV